MDAWLSALVAALAALSSAALTGYITWRLNQAQRVERRNSELAAAAAAYAIALDRVDFEIRHQPPPLGATATWTNRVTEKRFPHFDWLLTFISVRLFGRRALIAIDGFIVATNRLLLIAPAGLVGEIEHAAQLIERAAPREAGWRAEWTAMRASLPDERPGGRPRSWSACERCSAARRRACALMETLAFTDR